MQDAAGRDPDTTLAAGWRRSTPGLIAVGVFSLMIAVCRLAPPIFVLQVLDRVLSSESLPTLGMLAAVAVLALLTGAALEFLRRSLLIHWGAWIEKTYGPPVAMATLSARAGPRDGVAGPLRELGVLRRFVSSYAAVHWIDIWLSPVFLIVTYLIHPVLGAITALWIGIALVIGFLHEAATRHPRSASRQAQAEGRGWIDAAERHGDTVGGLGMGPNLVEAWRRTMARRVDESERLMLGSVYYATAMSFMIRCFRVVMIGVGVLFVIQGELSVGGLIAANVIGRFAVTAVEKAIMRLRDLKLAREAYSAVDMALRSPAALSTAADDLSLGALKLDQVSYRYHNNPTSVFRRVDHEVAPGRLLSVYGPAASGKTTFCKIVIGQLAPRSGKVLLGDVEPSLMSVERSAEAIGYLPQKVVLFDGTIRENIARMSAGDFGAVVEAAKMASIHETILRMPKGYDTVVSDDDAGLSVGEVKAIGLARAIYSIPSLIVLDEPEVHMDRAGRDALADTLVMLKALGSIVVVTSQSRRFNKIADGALRLSDRPTALSLHGVDGSSGGEE